MAFRDDYDFGSLENETERLVIEELSRQTSELEPRWLTEECVLDMTAYALNRLPALYTATLLGRVYAQATSAAELAERVRAAVADGISRVIDNPPSAS